jgi:ArsR family transcriptional regulator
MRTNAPTDRIDLIFRAFSDRTRLRILHLLRVNGETCVCDLVDVLGVPQPTASRHLAYLRRAKLVVARKDGLWQHYALAPAKGAFHRKMIECLESCFGDVPQLARDAAKVGKDGCCAKGTCCD